MTVEKFALVDAKTQKCLGLYLSNKYLNLTPSKNITINCYDSVADEFKTLDCVLSNTLGNLNEVEKYLVKEHSFEDRLVYSLSGTGVDLFIRQENKSGEILHNFIEKLTNSSLPANKETGKELSVLRSISGFVPMFEGENSIRNNVAKLPETAFIYRKDLGIVCLKDVRSIGENQYEVDYIKFSDIDESEDQTLTAIFDNTNYKLYGVLKSYIKI